MRGRSGNWQKQAQVAAAAVHAAQAAVSHYGGAKAAGAAAHNRAHNSPMIKMVLTAIKAKAGIIDPT